MEILTNSRRKFIANIGLITTGLCVGAGETFAFQPARDNKDKALHIGWITDLHHGFCKDAENRLDVFMHEASSRKLDFILQGGDFCHPTEKAKNFLNIWEKYKGERYHVLGNHDMDLGSKQQVMDLWGMKEKYYSFDKGDFHFVVMDCNYILKGGKYIDYVNSNYYIDQPSRDLVNPEQIEWLKEDLDKTEKQTIIISHQAFDEIWDGWSVPNRHLIRKVIDDANNRNDFQKVIACFCGHHHVDDHSYINKVHYFQMNSASYYYAGDGFGSDGGRAMYKDPLFTFVTIDPSGKIIIEGKQSQFLAPTPADNNHPDAPRLSAGITSKQERFHKK
ncbi:MAG: metallophosphoesterase family protein [Chitinophagaceae bacterium]